VSVVVVNAGFSFWQEYRAERAVVILKQLLPAYARVIRAGLEEKIPAAEVVPGDVLVLAEGDNIPADARVIEEYGLRTNHATLTGDAVPLRRTAEASLVEGISEVERPNLLFAGTSVASGTGRAVVFATGMLSQFGRIAHLTQEVHEGPSPLQREMRRITRVISVIALGVGTLVFFSGIFYLRWPVAEAFIFGVGIIVAAIPEGLLPTVTLTLAMAVQRLARRGVIVKKLAMVETLAKVSVICSDKSGTLTQNQMTVREVWCGGRMRSLSGVGYEPVGEFHPAADSDGARQDLTDLLTAGLVCNNARLIAPTPEHPRWASLGDQTEGWWARVASASAGQERGLLMMPIVDDEVLIAFEHDDVTRPYVIGSLWNGNGKPGPLVKTDGSFELMSDKFVDVTSKDSITIKTDKDFTLETKQKVTETADQDVHYESKTAKMELKAGTTLTIEGTQKVEIKCGPTLKFTLDPAGMKAEMTNGAATISLTGPQVRISGAQIQLG